jgi:hypothetical protein
MPASSIVVVVSDATAVLPDDAYGFKVFFRQLADATGWWAEPHDWTDRQPVAFHSLLQVEPRALASLLRKLRAVDVPAIALPSEVRTNGLESDG